MSEAMKRRFFPASIRDKRLLLLLPALIGVVLILLSTGRYGIGVSPDSVGYVAVARSLAAGKGAVLYDGSPLVDQPPLYPAMLAVIRVIFRIDPLAGSRFANAILFGLMVYLAGWVAMRQRPSSLFYAACAALATLFSRVLFTIGVMAWTEMLFAVLTLLFLVAAGKYRRSGDRSAVVWMGVLAGLACLTRYVGITLILSAFLVILLTRTNRPRSRWTHAALFMLIAVLPFALWIVRNRVVSGTPLGERAPATFPLPLSLQFTWRTFASWYLPVWATPHRWISAGLGAFVLGLAALGAVARRKRTEDGESDVSIPLFFIVVYVGVLVWTSSIAAYDRIGDRLLAPVFVPATLLLLQLLRAAPGFFKRRWAGRACVVVVSALVLATLGSWAMTARSNAAYRAKVGAGGYNMAEWQENRFCESLRSHGIPRGHAVYSNAPDAVYFFTNVPTMKSPLKKASTARKWVTDAERPEKPWPDKSPAVLVWFQTKYKREQFAPEELESFARMQTVSVFPDGMIYLVQAK
jgi:hypothetical protein